jgi:hypothetical protein
MGYRMHQLQLMVVSVGRMLKAWENNMKNRNSFPTGGLSTYGF